MPRPREVGDGPLEEADDGRRALVGEHLGVGQAGAVIDADVQELPAGPAGAGGAIAVDPVAGPLDAPELLDVDVDELARDGPLVADGRVAGVGGGQATEPTAAQHRPHRALGHPERARDPGPGEAQLAQGADRLLHLGARASGDPAGHRGAVGQLVVAGPIAPQPLPGAALAEAGRLGGRPQRPSLILDAPAQKPPHGRARPGVLMKCHRRVSLDRLHGSQPAASKEARTEERSCRLHLAPATVLSGRTGSRTLCGSLHCCARPGVVTRPSSPRTPQGGCQRTRVTAPTPPRRSGGNDLRRVASAEREQVRA